MVTFNNDPNNKDWDEVENADNAKDTAFAWYELGFSSAIAKARAEFGELLRSRRKQIRELEKQIEDMKCCGNCNDYFNQNPRCENGIDCEADVCNSWQSRI